MSTPTEQKYETLGEIGRGGMATVFVARARGAAGFQRLVAIKRAHPHLRGEAGATLKREAELAAHLQHPNVVRVLDVLEEQPGELALVLDYVDGGSLAELLGHGGDPVLASARERARVVVRIALDIAAGLDAAHRALGPDGAPAPVIHRDVSPSNVLVGVDGIARLTDFGIAKALEDGRDHTATGELKGKIAYMAPEYVESQRVDAGSDQFSFGVVVWEALATRRLFRGPTDLESMKRVVLANVPPLAGIDPLLGALDPVLARALARSRADRFASVGDLAEALESAARAADLVGTPREVGELVTRVMGEELTARRHGSTTRAPAGREPVARGREDPTRTQGLPAGGASALGHPPPGAQLAGLAQDPLASSSVTPERRRSPWWPALALALLVAVGIAGLGSLRRTGRDTSSAELTGGSGTSAPALAEPEPPAPTSTASAPATAEPITSATVTAPTRPPRASGPARRPPAVVPRKAPPNPYLH
ncbi:MAG: hypothetical protein JWP97_3471 [Labilithrix sp.]|nr:hypothetical protein [Labilithrix sp.]